jgi:serine/threonine protein kinase
MTKKGAASPLPDIRHDESSGESESVRGSPGDPALASTTNMPSGKGPSAELKLSEFIAMGNIVSHVESAVKELTATFHEILRGNNIEPGKQAIYDEVEDPRQCFSVLGMALQQFIDQTHSSFEALSKISASFQNPGMLTKRIPSTRFAGTGDSRLGFRSSTPNATFRSSGDPTRGGTLENLLEGFKFGVPADDALNGSTSNTDESEKLNMTQQNLWSSYASLAPDTVQATSETSHLEIKKDEDGNKVINGYEIIDEIGQGSFSKVKLAVRLSDEKTVAIKVMKKSLLRKTRQGGELTAWEQVQTEIAIMKKLRHRNVVALYEVIDDPTSNKLYLIMQYCEKGPIVHLRDDGTCDPLDDGLCRNYLRQLVSGLHYLHRHNVIHRDIKPDNILLGSDDTVYLTDFGVSEMMQEDDEIEGQQGTPAFFSPELCRGEGGVHGKAVDVWALGVTFYCLKFGRLPFAAANPKDIMQVIQNESLVFPHEATPDWIDLFRNMLNKDPRKRYTLPEVRHHEVVTGIKKEPEDDDAPGFVRRMRRMTEYDVITINEEDVRGAIAVAPMTVNVRTRPHAGQEKERGHFVEEIRERVRSVSPQSAPRDRDRSCLPDNRSPQPPASMRPTSTDNRRRHVGWDVKDEDAFLSTVPLPKHGRTDSASSRGSSQEPPSLGSTLPGRRSSESM